jgi:hypothetical protein
LDTFLSTIVLKDNTGTPPKGTSAEKNDKTIVDLSKAKGLIRAPTGAPARQNVLFKYGGTTSSEKGSLLGNMARKLFPMFATLPDQFDGVTGDNKYRADQDLYAQFIEYYKKESSDKPNVYNNFIQQYTGNDTASTEARNPGQVSKLGFSYSYLKSSQLINSNGEDDGTLVLKNYKSLLNGSFTTRYNTFQSTTNKSPNASDFSFKSTPSEGKPVDISSKTDYSNQIAQKFTSEVIYKNTNPFAFGVDAACSSHSFQSFLFT